MKLTKIVLALSCMLVTTSTFAASVTLAEINDARNNNTLQQAWISGATAPTRTIYEGWVGPDAVGCDVDTNTIFTSEPTTTTNLQPGSIGNYSAYACKRNGVVSILYHTLDGGSLNYVTPHSIGTKLARLAFPVLPNGTANCTGTGVQFTDATNSQNNALVYKGCVRVGNPLVLVNGVPTNNAANQTAIAGDPIAPQLPVGGFSDVEAALFPQAIGGGNIAAFGTESPAGVAQMFGVAVSVPAYRAMQVKQGIFSSVADADTNDSTFTPANAPNISSAEYTSAAAVGGSYANTSGWLRLANVTGKRMNIQRRVPTSGTQASSNAFFLRNPCSAGVGGALNPLTASSTAGLLVQENSGSGDVKSGLSTASNAVATSTSNFAMGVLSLENDWRSEAGPAVGSGLTFGPRQGYRYLKVDGVHPETGDTANARVSATNGNYRFVMELVNFVRNDTAGAKTPFEAAIVGDITAALSSPVATACPTFPRGLALTPKVTNVCTVGIQVMKGTVSGNNCAQQRLSF